MNDFEGGGLAIGLSCTHMHADLTSVIILFNSWAELHRGESIAHPPVFHPPALQGRSPSKISTKSAKCYTNKSRAEPHPVKMATATFRFSDSVIRKCLSGILVECPGATPFDVLAALFWTLVVKLKPPAQNPTHNLSICTDFRRLIHPPIPFGYFGNALHFSQLSLDSEALEGSGSEHLAVALAVHHHVAGLSEEEFWSVTELFESNKEEMKEHRQPFRMYGPELTCVSLEHMIILEGSKGNASGSLMYEAMFKKDEKPVHVSYHVGNVVGEGLIVVMPSLEEGLGRTVAVTLPEEQIAKLCEDQAILDLEPTVLMKGS